MHNLTHKLKHYLDGSRQLEDTFKYSTVLYAVAFIHLIITIVFLHYNIIFHVNTPFYFDKYLQTL